MNKRKFDSVICSLNKQIKAEKFAVEYLKQKDHDLKSLRYAKKCVKEIYFIRKN